MRRTLVLVAVGITVVLSGCAVGSYDFAASQGGGQAAPTGASQSIGYAAGGAQDANAFRTNVREGYVPQPTDLTYEGLYHDYYFDTGGGEDCTELFCPSFSRAVSTDPVSNQTERFLTVGLNSGISQADFERKRLNLVVVVDTSSSMDSQFDRYYYDGGQTEAVDSTETKMAAARDALSTLTSHMGADDRLGVVAYDSQTRVVQDVRRVGDLPEGQLANRVEGIRADGSTNLDAGMRTGVEMLRPYTDANESAVENRVIYLTDAQPNVGDTRSGSLSERLSGHAADTIHTTFVGVGVDFNSRLVESIYSVRGANYYAIHSPDQFRERMREGFDYMVTPLVFDLSLSMDAEGYRIDHVYGTDSNASTDELMHVNTLFPSRREDNRTEGGVILLELDRTGENPRLALETSYEDRTGETYRTSRNVSFGDRTTPSYETTGVRKAVALARYGAAVRNWAAHERAQQGGQPRNETAAESGAADVAPPPDEGVAHRELGRWEQQSVPLGVSPPYDERLRTIHEYLQSERDALGAERMDRDLAVLANVTATAGEPPATAVAD